MGYDDELHAFQITCMWSIIKHLSVVFIRMYFKTLFLMSIYGEDFSFALFNYVDLGICRASAYHKMSSDFPHENTQIKYQLHVAKNRHSFLYKKGWLHFIMMNQIIVSILSDLSHVVIWF